MVLPSGVALPPLPHLLVVAAAVAGVGWLLVRERPPVADRTILAFGPWMVLGSTLYVAYQLQLFPEPIAPFFGSPIVYATTAAVAGAIWVFARRTARPLLTLGAVGGVLTVFPVLAALQFGLEHDSLTLAWPLAAVGVAAVLGHVAWAGLEYVRPQDAAATGAAGALAVFAHVLDGASTAVGVDVLGFGEQTPLSALIMEFAGTLPTADLLGVGWLFVVVKTLLACAVVALMAEYVRDEPREGYLVLALVTAVGLGPGAHNVLLFIAATPGL